MPCATARSRWFRGWTLFWVMSVQWLVDPGDDLRDRRRYACSPAIAEQPGRQKEQCLDERECRADADADETKRQRQQPQERREHEHKQRERPRDHEQDEPCDA